MSQPQPNTCALPPARQVRAIQDAQERLKKEMKDMKRSESSKSLKGSEEAERLRQQLEADKLEVGGGSRGVIAHWGRLLVCGCRLLGWCLATARSKG